MLIKSGNLKVPSRLVDPDLMGFKLNLNTNGPIGSYIPNPVVVEQTARGERQYDIFSRLLIDRIVFLGTEINETVANLIVAQMFFLESSDPEKPIHLYINSPGGGVSSGLAIYDVMQFVKNEVYTYCIGMAASMGAVLLAAGDHGKRFGLPNCRIMLHQPLGGAHGQASDIEIQAREILRIKRTLNEILARHTSQPLEKIEIDTDRDNYLSAKEALDYGLIDKVVEKHVAL